MEKWAGPIALLTVTGIVAYLIYKATQKKPSSSISDAVDSIGNFFNQYEFNSDTGDPNDPSNVFIPTM